MYCELKYGQDIIFKNNIKFRGKILTTDKWIYGFPVFHQNEVDINSGNGVSIAVKPETLGRFIGILNFEKKRKFMKGIFFLKNQDIFSVELKLLQQ